MNRERGATRADVAHLKDGDEVEFVFVIDGEPRRVTATAYPGVKGCLAAAGWIIRDRDGNPHQYLIEVISPQPPAPVGQRRRSPYGVEVILGDDETDLSPWIVYRGGAIRERRWMSDDEVLDWEIISN